MRRKILSVALVFSMVLCIAGCGDKSSRKQGEMTVPEGTATVAAADLADKAEGNFASLNIEEQKGLSGTVAQWASVGAVLPLTIHNNWGTAINKIWMSGDGDQTYYLLDNSAIAPGGTVNTYTTVYGGYTKYDIEVEFANGDSVEYTIDIGGCDINGVEIWISYDGNGNDVISWC